MKKAGIALLVIGILLTVFTGFRYITEKKVVDIGKLEITKEQPHHVNWSPILGVGMIVAGGVLLFTSTKQRP